MTHKIYWAERGLRYLYEVVAAELFMYTSAVCGCYLDRGNISVVLSDQRFCTESYITYRWTSGASGTSGYLAGYSMDPGGYRNL